MNIFTLVTVYLGSSDNEDLCISLNCLQSPLKCLVSTFYRRCPRSQTKSIQELRLKPKFPTTPPHCFHNIHSHSKYTLTEPHLHARNCAKSGKRDKQGKTTTINVVHTHNGILFNLKQILTCYNTDELGGHYAEWNKPLTKGHILYDYTSMRYVEQSNW